MKRLLLSIVFFAVFCLSPAAFAQAPDSVALLHEQDLRLARIGDAMLRANHALCRQTMPVTGMIIHSRDQYDTIPTESFANGNVTILAITPGSPAEQAGLAPGDAVLSVAGQSLAALEPQGEAPVRDAVFDLLASQPTAAPLALRIARDGAISDVTLHAPPGCRALIEILSGSGSTARSDGRVIQISYGMATRLSDEGLAAVLAHELAHSVLEHRRRLVEAGVSKGLLGEFGGNQQRNRQVEAEADRLSVHLLANTGLDPQIAPQLWRSPEGRRLDSGLLRSWAYPSPSARAEVMEREIAAFLPFGTGPSFPGHLLARRDSAF